MSTSTPQSTFMTPEAFRSHWQGHRALTRRVIEAFPDDHLFAFSVAGMRPFGAMAKEMLAMGVPMLRGVVSGEWREFAHPEVGSRAELLRAWDEDTEAIDRLLPEIGAERFRETITAFGQYTAPLHDLLMYAVDNEIHHRGQGYVYLRALGIEPPPFWERA
jgi:uncharacterized damage-inducible protein DinB